MFFEDADARSRRIIADLFLLQGHVYASNHLRVRCCGVQCHPFYLVEQVWKLLLQLLVSD